MDDADKGLVTTRVRRNEGEHGTGFWVDVWLAGEKLISLFSRHEPTQEMQDDVAAKVADAHVLPSEPGAADAERADLVAKKAAAEEEARQAALAAQKQAEEDAAAAKEAADAEAAAKEAEVKQTGALEPSGEGLPAVGGEPDPHAPPMPPANGHEAGQPPAA